MPSHSCLCTLSGVVPAGWSIWAAYNTCHGEVVTVRKMSDIVRNQDPVTLPPSATVKEACQCMRERRVGAILVTEDDGRLAGIFTGRDAVHRVMAEGRSAIDTILADVMTREPHTMPPGQDGDRSPAVDGRRPLSAPADRR